MELYNKKKNKKKIECIAASNKKKIYSLILRRQCFIERSSIQWLTPKRRQWLEQSWPEGCRSLLHCLARPLAGTCMRSGAARIQTSTQTGCWHLRASPVAHLKASLPSCVIIFKIWLMYTSEQISIHTQIIIFICHKYKRIPFCNRTAMPKNQISLQHSLSSNTVLPS